MYERVSKDLMFIIVIALLRNVSASSDIELSVRPVNPVYLLNEPVVVKVNVANRSSALKTLFFTYPWTTGVEFLDESGKIWKRDKEELYVREKLMGFQGSRIILQPGESKSYSMVLSSFFRDLAPGKHKVLFKSNFISCRPHPLLDSKFVGIIPSPDGGLPILKMTDEYSSDAEIKMEPEQRGEFEFSINVNSQFQFVSGHLESDLRNVRQLENGYFYIDYICALNSDKADEVLIKFIRDDERYLVHALCVFSNASFGAGRIQTFCERAGALFDNEHNAQLSSDQLERGARYLDASLNAFQTLKCVPRREFLAEQLNSVNPMRIERTLDYVLRFGTPKTFPLEEVAKLSRSDNTTIARLCLRLLAKYREENSKERF